MLTIGQTTAALIVEAREAYIDGRITAGDQRDILSALEGNGSAIPLVRTFLRSRARA